MSKKGQKEKPTLQGELNKKSHAYIIGGKPRKSKMENNLIPMKKQGAIITVTSLQVAKDFGKLHKDVLDGIRNLAAENSAVKLMFEESTYKNRGKDYPAYAITRDGFLLLVMGFTGKDALAWKLKYIETFNMMENYITPKVPVVSMHTAPILAVCDQLLLIAREQDARITALEKAVAEGPKDWLAVTKERIEGITGLKFQHSTLFLTDLYTKLEKIENVLLKSRQSRQWSKMRKQGKTSKEIETATILFVISKDEILKARFENLIEKREVGRHAESRF